LFWAHKYNLIYKKALKFTDLGAFLFLVSL